jgi:hypothetical protein
MFAGCQVGSRGRTRQGAVRRVRRLSGISGIVLSFVSPSAAVKSASGPGAQVYNRLRKARKRGGATVDVKDIVSRDPEVVSGALVFTKTRVPVQSLVNYLSAGRPLDEFLDDFPG